MPAIAREFAFPGGPTVNRMGFGAMRLCGPDVWGKPDDSGAARVVLRRAIELGINFIDTADAYGPECNEEQIAEALHPYPEGLVIATKGGLVRPPDRSWQRDGRPVHLREACEASLRRLRCERIDLYQLHAPDPNVPFLEQVRALAQLRDEGLVAMVGLSNVSVAQLRLALDLVPIASVQNRFNYADFGHVDVLAECERLGVAFLPWYPLAVGQLVGTRSPLVDVADELGATPWQVAIAWLLHLSDVVIPIPGTSQVAHLEENVAAAQLELSEQHMRKLGQLVDSRIVTG
ncbi:MAG TPA: aldo/keto reductase [Enhygromyxa sp.]|nr:aldo/keto reductase [Enhygromyxa sp.]